MIQCVWHCLIRFISSSGIYLFFSCLSIALIQCCNLLSWKCWSLPLQFCTCCKLVQLTLESLGRLTKLPNWRVFSRFSPQLDFVASMAHLSIQIITTRFSVFIFPILLICFFMLHLSLNFLNLWSCFLVTIGLVVIHGRLYYWRIRSQATTFLGRLIITKIN